MNVGLFAGIGSARIPSIHGRDLRDRIGKLGRYRLGHRREVPRSGEEDGVEIIVLLVGTVGMHPKLGLFERSSGDNIGNLIVGPTSPPLCEQR